MYNSELMKNGSLSLCTEFTLVAFFFSSRATACPLFCVLGYLPIYYGEKHHHHLCHLGHPFLLMPMYFPLVNLSFLEMCYISTVVPQMLVHLLAQLKTISVGGCAAQMYVFTVLGLTECCLLATMAYDCFVAICYPLHYTLRMGPSVCLKLAGASWMTGILVESAQTTWIFTLPFCGAGTIQHFFCDIMPVIKLACVDTSQNEILLSIISLIFIMSPCLFTLCSNVHILLTILKMPSASGRHKAFSTCSSHILIVSLFYGTALFTYLQPKISYTPDTNKATALMYTVVTSALNPDTYTLRKK